jgi:hypothetical protein
MTATAKFCLGATSMVFAVALLVVLGLAVRGIKMVPSAYEYLSPDGNVAGIIVGMSVVVGGAILYARWLLESFFLGTGRVAWLVEQTGGYLPATSTETSPLLLAGVVPEAEAAGSVGSDP